MMAATVLVFAFLGMITTLTVGNEMMATARRQTLASKMIDHELEALRYVDWTTLSGLTGSHSSYTTLVWNSATNYRTRDLVVLSSNGKWYRCLQNHINRNPSSNAAHWSEITPPWSVAFNASGVAEGVSFALTREVADVSGLTNVKEFTFTITWTTTPSGLSTRTYTRRKSGYFGQYGLNLTYQRS